MLPGVPIDWYERQRLSYVCRTSVLLNGIIDPTDFVKRNKTTTIGGDRTRVHSFEDWFEGILIDAAFYPFPRCIIFFSQNSRASEKWFTSSIFVRGEQRLRSGLLRDRKNVWDKAGENEKERERERERGVKSRSPRDLPSPVSFCTKWTVRTVSSPRLRSSSSPPTSLSGRLEGYRANPRTRD